MARPQHPLGISGRIAQAFQAAQITPLLALLALLLGLFAVLVTPREEEPQIDVTMANVIVPFPGASVADVEQLIATPAEQVLSQMLGVEHVTSVSRPGMAVLTVQFKVGVHRNDALVRLHDTLRSHADWLPRGLGAMEPIIRPKGIDDVPVVTLTLYSEQDDTGAYDLERVAHSMEAELMRVDGARTVSTIGGPGRAVRVQLDAARMAGRGVTVDDIRATLQSANQGLPVGELLGGNQSVAIEAGPFLARAREVGELVVSSRGGKPVFLQDVAQVEDGPLPAQRYVWYASVKDGQASEYPAVTLAVTKKAGANAIAVARAVMQRVQDLRGTVIPAAVQVAETRDYGATANDKAQKLIQKLLFATVSVVALVFIALGRREALIVGVAVGLTLAATLFASWAWGFTLNRVSLFALIFSIGILVDDAIVVVENIHRHQALYPEKTLAQLIPGVVKKDLTADHKLFVGPCMSAVPGSGPGIAVEKWLRVPAPVFAVVAPRQHCIADTGMRAGVAEIPRRQAGLAVQIIAQDLHQTDEQIPAGHDAGHTVKLGLSLFARRGRVGHDDRPRLAPVHKVVADTHVRNAAVTRPGRIQFHTKRNECHVAPAHRVPVDGVDIMAVAQHRSGSQFPPSHTVG